MAEDEPVGLGAAADELYGGTPEEFVATRTALVKAARAEKNRPLADAIAGLRRPTRSAWLVNLLAREATDDLAALLDVGAALRAAQEQLAAAELRSLSQDRRRAVDALLRRAVELAAEHDYDPPESARQEVSATLQAALADPATSDQVRRGVIAQPLSYGGFGPLDLTAAATPRSPARPAEPKTERSDRSGDDDAAQAAEQKRREDAQRAEELDAAQQASDQARQRAEEATAEADRLAEEVDALRERLAELEQASRQAQRDARAARREAEEAESARAAAAVRAER